MLERHEHCTAQVSSPAKLRRPRRTRQPGALPQLIRILPPRVHIAPRSFLPGRWRMGLLTASASVKAAVLIGISLLLLIPLGLLQSLVAERTIQRDAAVASVARGWGDRQWVGGPVLAIPVTDGGNPQRTVD